MGHSSAWERYRRAGSEYEELPYVMVLRCPCGERISFVPEPYDPDTQAGDTVVLPVRCPGCGRPDVACAVLKPALEPALLIPETTGHP